MKRYGWNDACSGMGISCYADLVPNADGDWVDADDALARIAELEARTRELEERIKRYEAWLGEWRFANDEEECE